MSDERDQGIGNALFMSAIASRLGVVPEQPIAQIVNSSLDPFASDSIKLGVQNDHVIVAIEHLAATTLPLALLAGQPIISPALIFTASHGLLELVEILRDGQGNQLKLLGLGQRRPFMRLPHHPGVINRDPPLLGRLERGRQRL